MIIKISGDKEKIAELVSELVNLGYPVNSNVIDNPNWASDKQSITIATKATKDIIFWFKFLKPKFVYSDKELNINFISHRKHFISKVKEYYGQRRTASKSK